MNLKQMEKWLESLGLCGNMRQLAGEFSPGLGKKVTCIYKNIFVSITLLIHVSKLGHFMSSLDIFIPRFARNLHLL